MNGIREHPDRKEIVDEMKALGEIPGEPLKQTGSFTFQNHEVIMGDAVNMATMKTSDSDEEKIQKDIVHNDDTIITNSLCVGFDCVNNENFGFDTIRLKENNLRIKFEDTSTGTFPSTDWQLTANESTSGGQSKFSIDDITNARVPFTIESAAPTNSLYVDNTGNIGMGTSNPVLESHIVDGDTPGIRLEQDGSSGWQPQTWDLAGNETNFFLRDVTNGSRLPFKVRPGAPTNSLYIDPEGNIGFGTASPAARLDVVGDARVSGTLSVDTVANSNGEEFLHHNGGNDVFLKNESGFSSRVSLLARGNMTFQIDSNADQVDRIFTWSHDGDQCCNGTPLMVLRENGELIVNGSIKVNGTTLNVPDYVFEEDYSLMSLESVSSYIDQHGHLPEVPSAQEINREGLKVEEFQLLLLKKIEELTLHTIEQQKEIENLKQLVQDSK
jgi:hypothetical protein